MNKVITKKGKFFVAHPTDSYWLIKWDTGYMRINYRWLTEFAPTKRRQFYVDFAAKHGGATLVPKGGITI